MLESWSEDGSGGNNEYIYSCTFLDVNKTVDGRWRGGICHQSGAHASGWIAFSHLIEDCAVNEYTNKV